MPPTLTTASRLAALCVALLLAGCRVDLAVGLAVARDGSGEVTVSLAADDEARTAGGDPLDDVLAAGRALRGQGWTVTDDAVGGVRRVVLTRAFEDPEALEAVTTELADALDQPEGRLLEPFTVTVTDQEILLRGGAGLVPTPVVAEYGVDPQDLARTLGDSFSYTVTVALPAGVEAAPGARVDAEAGRAVFDIGVGEAVAVEVAGPRPRRPAAWLVATGTAAAVGLAGVLLLTRRRGEEDEADVTTPPRRRSAPSPSGRTPTSPSPEPPGRTSRP